jgi:hypothetical protein
LIKKKSLSSWKVEFKNDNTEIYINSLTFLDRGKVKTIIPSDVLGNLPIYKKVNNPLIVLHYNTDESISNEQTDYFTDNCIYYDLDNKCIYIRFDDYLHEGQSHRWIKYDKHRIRSYYQN